MATAHSPVPAPVPAPARPEARVELRVVELASITVGDGVWMPAPDDPATLRAAARLHAVGYVLDGAAGGGDLLDPFLVDGRLRLVYGGDWLAALRRLGESHARALVAPALPEDESFRLLLGHLLRPVPASATPMAIHRAERPIRELIRKAAKERQRSAGRQTAAARWRGERSPRVASEDFPEATGLSIPSAVADVLTAAFDAVNSRGDTRSKHKLLGLTSSADEYEAIEKILAVAGDPTEDATVRQLAIEQAAALDTPQPPAISTALRRVLEARQNAHAHAVPVARASREEAEPAALVDAVLAALQACVERLDELLSPREDAASVLVQSDDGARRFRAAAAAAREIPDLLASVAAVL